MILLQKNLYYLILSIITEQHELVAEKRVIAKIQLNNHYTQYDIMTKKNHNFVINDIVAHNSSTHIGWNLSNDSPLHIFSGGIKHNLFIKIFDQDFLLEKFKETGLAKVVIYGEGYGGKCQRMSKTYGKDTQFVVFDVNIDNKWLSVEQARDFAQTFNLDFVDYVKIPTDLAAIDEQRDRDSTQAIRNGMGEGHKREGIILRPLIEVTKNNGNRIIAKHKRDEFRETKTPRKVNKEQLKVLKEANAVAEEWVTEMRLTHVLNKLQNPGIEHTKSVIAAMIEDVKTEGEGEIEWSKPVEKSIGKKTAHMFKQRLQSCLK